jgi:hypothetical protein
LQRLIGVAARSLRLMRAMIGHGDAMRALVGRSLGRTAPTSDPASRLPGPAVKGPFNRLHLRSRDLQQIGAGLDILMSILYVLMHAHHHPARRRSSS